MRLVIRSLCLLTLTSLLLAPAAKAAGALTITSPGSSLTFTTGVVQIPLQASGGIAPYTWSVSTGSLPAGLAIRTDVPSFFNPLATAGIIGVAPTSDGGTPYSFTIQVQDSTPGTPQTANLPVSLHITAENFQDLNNLPDAIASANYSYTFTILNGHSPAVSLANSTSLPQGLTLTGNTISGTVTAAPNQYNFQLQIVDGADTIFHSFNIKVAGPHITNSLPLANATQGQASYSQQLTASGGSGGYSYQLTGGSLPNGLSLSSGGLISGSVCNCAGPNTYNFAVTVTDSSSSSYQQFLEISVIAVPPVLPSLPTLTLDDQTVGIPVSLGFTANGGVAPYTWSVTGLPTGMSFRSGAGTSSNINFGNLEIWGVPQATGTYQVTMTATDSNNVSVSQTYPLHISPLAFQQISGNLNGSFTLGTAISPAFSLRVLGGTAGYIPLLTSGRLPFGTSISGAATGLSVSGTPAENGNFSYVVRVTDSTGGTPNSLTRTLNDQVAPSAIQIFTNSFIGSFLTGNSINFGLNACCDGSNSFTWTVPTANGNALPSGLNLNSSTGALSGTVNAAGSSSFFVQAADPSNASSYAVKLLSIYFTPISITTNNVPYGNVNVAYSGLQFAASGTAQNATLTWSAGNNGFLPPGMSLSSGGLLGGMPTSTGQYNFTVTVSDGTNSASRNYSISIYPAGQAPPVIISSGANVGSFPRGDVEADLFATGGNGVFTWTLQSGSLPPGLAIRKDLTNNASINQGSQAALIGVATTAGQYSFTLQVNSATSTATRAFTMTIGPLSMDDSFNLPDAFVGTAYIGSATIPGYTFTPVLPAGATTFTLNSGNNLPPGLSISSSGTISGTPNTAGNYNFTIVSNDGTNTLFRGYNLNVYKIQITTPTRLPNAQQGQTYTQSLAATDSAAGTVTFTANGLPNGLTIQSGNVITGTVNSNAGPGLYNVGITASDGTNSYTENFSIDVIATNAQMTRISVFNTSDAVEGDFYSTSIGVCCGGNGPFTWTASGLPPGFAIRYAGSGTVGTSSGTENSYVTPGNLEIYGVPTSDSSPNNAVTVTATDGLGNSTSQTFSLHVSRLNETRGIPSGTIGTAYQQVLRPVGGVPGYTVSLASGALPAGLSLSSTTIGGVNTAMLSGMPMESGNFNFSLTYSDSAGTPNTLTRFYGINIANSTASNLQINTNSPLQPMVTGNTINNLTLNACCDASNTYSWSIVGGALPSGLSLNSSTGAVTGTATPAGNYTFLVQVADPSNNSNTARKQFTLQISALHITTNSIPFGNLTLQYGGSVAGFTLAGTGGVNTLMWSLAPGTFLPPGITLSSAGVLTGIPTSMGQYQPTFVVTDGVNTTSSNYTLNVYSATGGPALAITTGSNFGTWQIGYRQFELDASGGTGAYTWSIVSGSLPAGYALRTDLPSFFSASASAGIIGVGTGTGAAGAGSTTSSFTLQVTSGSQTATKAFTLTIAQLDFKDPYLPDAYVGQAYNGSGYTMSALNANPSGTVTFVATPAPCGANGGNQTNCLPPGLTMSSSGAITGTPTTAGAYFFNVALSDGTSTVNSQYSINTYAIDITTAGQLPNATQGTAYSSGPLTAVGGNGTLTWAAQNGLPSGFSINSATGAITAAAGFNAGPGVYQVTVNVTDQNSVASTKRFMLDVIGVPATLPSLNVGNVDDATVGNPVNYGFGVGSGGAAPFIYTATGLPPGMSIRSTVPTINNNQAPDEPQIWGTASVVGTYNVTITATDLNGVTATAAFPLHVSPLSHDGLPQGTLGIAYNQNLRIVGGTGPYSVTKTVQGALPDGLVRTGLNVAGTPVEDGGFNITYQYSDSAATPNTLVRTDFINIGDGSNTFQINNNGNLGTVTANFSYSNTLTACCVPNSLAWSVINGSLPTGITLGPSTGILSGTPTVPGTYTFLVQASENGVGTPNNAFRFFTMIVTPIALTSNNGNTNLPYGVVGTSYTGGTLTTTDSAGTVSGWTVNAGSYLPPGMTLIGSVIGGTPTTSGQYSFTLTGTDGTNIIVRNFNLAIYPMGGGPPLFLGTGPNFNFSVGTQTIQLSASGGTPPYTYSLTPSATTAPGCRVQNGQPLPTNFSPGITAGVLCVLTTPGTYPTSIRVTDSATPANTFDRPITITVSPLLIEIQGVLPNAYVNQPNYTFNPISTNGVMATGGAGAYTFSATNLPPGLSIDSSSGVISGSPTTAGNYNPGITVGNASVTGTVGFGFSLRVNTYQITTTSTLPQATLGTAYNQTLTSTCSSSCTWSIVSGNLPSGLSLSTNGNNGVISGTPTSTFDGSFTIQVGSNSTQQIFSLIVAPNTLTAPSVTTNITTTPTIGSQVSTGLFAAGGKPPYTFSVSAGSLPPGIYLQSPGDQVGGNLAPSTQYLAGRPTTVGSYPFTIQVTDSTTGTALIATKAFTWNISALNLSYPNLPLSGTTLTLNQGSPYSQPLLIIGGNGTYQNFSVSSALQPGLSLGASSGIVSGIPTNTGTVNTTLSVSDTSGTPNTLAAGLNVSVASGANGTVTLGGPAAGTIVPLGAPNTFTVNPSGGTGPYMLSAVGALPAGVILESGATLGSSFGTGSEGFQALFEAPGTYTFTLQAVDSSVPSQTGERTYTLVVPDFGPVLSNTTLAQGSVSVPYSQQIYAFDNSATLTWAIAPGSAPPPGLTLSSSGVLSGTPSTGSAGTYTFAATLTDASGSFTATFTLKISNLAISTAGALPVASVSVPYGTAGAGVTLVATGGSGSTTWAVTSGSLPSGLSLNPGTGLISGTPDGNTGTGFFAFAVTASNSGGSVSKGFSLNLGQQNPTILNYPMYQAALPDAILGQNFQFNLTAAGGGVAPYTWSVASGSTLPPGLSLVQLSSLNAGTSPGVTSIVGSPSTVGQYTFNLVLTDSTTATVTRTFTLNVTPISITINNPRSATQGTPYSFQFQAAGGSGSYSYSYVPNPNNLGQEALPPGLTLNSSGLLSGTPTGTGTYSFVLTVLDSGTHKTLSRTLSITSTNSLGTAITNTSGSLFVNTPLNTPATVSSAGTYNWAILPVSPAPAAPIINGVPPGVTLQSGSFVGNPTAAGTYQFVLQATNAANSSDVALRTLTIVISPISMTSPVETGLFGPSFPGATVNQAYSFQFVAAGGVAPYTFTEAPTYPLPPGMTLSSTGLMSGTPTQSGSFAIRPIVTDANGATDIKFQTSLIVVPPGGHPPLEARNASFSTTASVGVPFALALDRLVYPGVPPFTWSVATGPSLPPGMSIIHGANGVSDLFAGTPTAAGTYNFSLVVTDSVGQTLTIPTGGFPVSVLSTSPSSLPTAIRGSAYSATLTVTGGTPPYSFQYDQGFAPPPGLSINNGVISGTPTYAGVFPIGFVVKDSLNNTFTYDYEFSVDDAAGEVPSVAVAPKPVTILFITGSATTSTPVTVSSSSGTLPYNLALYGIAGASLTSTSGSTNGSTNINFGSLGVGSYSGFLAASAPGAVNSGDVTPIGITVLAPPPCTYTLSPDTTSSPIGGNSGNINISAGSGCAWTAAASNAAPWITLTGTTSGSGNGTVPFSTGANATGNPRTGTVTITGTNSSTVTFTINQFAAGCSFSISPSTINATAAGGPATVNIISSGSACNWTASGLSVSSASGIGSGSVTVTIPANSVNAPAVSTATIANQTLTVNQSAANCVYSLSSSTATFAAAGGSSSVNVTATSGCPVTTILGPSWINVTSGGSGTGTGGAQALTYTVDPNSTTQPRTGALTISGQTYAITEQALACSVSVDTSTLGSPFASGGGLGTLGITTNGSNCSWTAASNSSFVNVSPVNGFGNGTVNVTASSNAASTNPRNGSVSISGQTIAFSQAGTTCNYSLRSSSSSMPSTGGLATVSVVAPSACVWTATANNGFLSIVNAGSSGSADVTFSAAPNATAAAVNGTLTVAGLTFNVTEAAAPCTFTLGSSSSGVLGSAPANNLTVNYTTSASGCATPVNSYSNWITASNTSYAGTSGTATYSIAANASGTTRSGNIQIGDKVFTVIQTGQNCAYSINSYGISVNFLGATSSILGSANAGNCPNPPDGSTQPFVQVGTLTGTPALYTLPFVVSPFSSTTTTIRTGTITFGGLTFYVKQSSF